MTASNLTKKLTTLSILLCDMIHAGHLLLIWLKLCCEVSNEPLECDSLKMW